MTGVLESHNMSSTPKGSRKTGGLALNCGGKPGESLDLPSEAARGGDVNVDLIQRTRQNTIWLFLLTCFLQVGNTNYGHL